MFIAGAGKDFNMICKLCLKEKPLIKAHIIPDFLYTNTGLYEHTEKGQPFLRSAIYQKDNLYRKNNPLYDGEYDPNILCSDCDNVRLGLFEDYSRKVLWDENHKLPSLKYDIVTDPLLGYEYLFVQNLEYTNFKLFLISMFWRASISDRKFSGEVKLGDNLNTLLRNMIWETEPKEPDDFAVTLHFVIDPEIPKEFVVNFKKFETDKTNHYSFIIGGMMFSFFPDKKDIPDCALPFLLKKSGDFKIPFVKGNDARQTILAFFNKKI